jgi:hypothetical protein
MSNEHQQQAVIRHPYDMKILKDRRLRDCMDTYYNLMGQQLVYQNLENQVEGQLPQSNQFLQQSQEILHDFEDANAR